MSRFWQEVVWGIAAYLFLVFVMDAPAWAGCVGGWVMILLRRVS